MNPFKSSSENLHDALTTSHMSCIRGIKRVNSHRHRDILVICESCECAVCVYNINIIYKYIIIIIQFEFSYLVNIITSIILYIAQFKYYYMICIQLNTFTI